MKSIFLLLIVCIRVGLQASGQGNFLPGYVLLPGKDTMRGMIDYKGWDHNPTRIVFKSKVDAPENILTRSDIEGFGIDGKDAYKRAFVSIDMNPVNTHEVTLNQSDSTRSDTVFLRVLVAGDYLSLYEFIHSKSNYYVRQGNGIIEELIYKISFNETNTVLITNNGFREQLKRIFAEKPVAGVKKETIEQLRYERKDLSRFILSMNDPNKTSIPSEPFKMKEHSQFFAGGGLVMGKMGFQGSGNDVLTSLRFKSMTSYLLSAGADWYLSRSMQLVLRTELSVSGFSADGAGTSGSSTSFSKSDNTYSMRQTNITPAISMHYIFSHAGNIRFYAGGGFGYNLSSYSRHRLTSTYQLTGSVTVQDDFPILQTQWLAVFLRIGLYLTKNFEMGITRPFGGSFLHYTSVYETSNPVFIHFYYKFR